MKRKENIQIFISDYETILTKIATPFSNLEISSSEIKKKYFMGYFYGTPGISVQLLGYYSLYIGLVKLLWQPYTKVKQTKQLEICGLLVERI